MTRTKLIAYLGDFIRKNELLISTCYDLTTGQRLGWFLFKNYTPEEMERLAMEAAKECNEVPELVWCSHWAGHGLENGPAYYDNVKYTHPIDPTQDVRIHVQTESITPLKYRVITGGHERIYNAGLLIRLTIAKDCPPFSCSRPCGPGDYYKGGKCDINGCFSDKP